MGLLSYMATHADDLLEATAEHLMLLGATMLISCAIAALITVACLRNRPLGNAVVEVLGAAYAIPSLALFALLIPLTGLGFTSAVIVMVVYNQFMLVRNALEGIRGVDPALIEAARGMGLSDSQVLLKVQLPLALPAIIAGVRLACISTIGIATIAATINAGGLGMILLSGLRSMNIDKILAGTICCAALALALDSTLRLIEARSHLVHRDKPGAARRQTGTLCTRPRRRGARCTMEARHDVEHRSRTGAPNGNRGNRVRRADSRSACPQDRRR